MCNYLYIEPTLGELSQDIYELRIKKNDWYILACQNNNLIFIDFKKYSKITLIENYNKTVVYNIKELADSIISKRKLLEFKSKICALYFFGKIDLN